MFWDKSLRQILEMTDDGRKHLSLKMTDMHTSLCISLQIGVTADKVAFRLCLYSLIVYR
jgi:hypothetical protein